MELHTGYIATPMQPRNAIAVYGMRKPVLDSRALVSYTVHKNCGLHNQCRVQQYTIYSSRAVKLQTMCILVARELTPTLHSTRLYLDINILEMKLQVLWWRMAHQCYCGRIRVIVGQALFECL